MSAPRTDAHLSSIDIENEDSCCSIYVRVDGTLYDGELATADFARQLETELQAAQRNEARLREAGKLALQSIRDGKIDDARLHLEGARL